jgi:GxxExxY protein
MPTRPTKTADVRDPRTHALIGAAMEVHSHLGSGFLEQVYHEARALEFTERDIPFRREVALPITYKERRLDTAYRADFLCFDSIVVEIKAIANTGIAEEAQMVNYLRATGKELGLLLNFGTRSLTYRRFVRSTK